MLTNVEREIVLVGIETIPETRAEILRIVDIEIIHTGTVAMARKIQKL